MSGFVYLWFDRKRKMYYVGSHWGSEDDGYICSSKWMRDAYHKRPQDFKRRIISRVDTNRQALLIEEHRYLLMIKDEELGKRYYNIRIWKLDHWTSSEDNEYTLSIKEKISKAKKGKPSTFKGKTHTEEAKEKNRQAQLAITQSEGYINPFEGQFHTEEALEKNRQAHIGRSHTDETKALISKISKERGAKPPVRNKPHSEETKAKMRQAALGKPKSDAHKQAIKEARANQIITDEHKANISKGGKNRWANMTPEARTAFSETMKRARQKSLINT